MVDKEQIKKLISKLEEMDLEDKLNSDEYLLNFL